MLKLPINKKKRLLFLGIGGYGMRGLAEICHDQGCTLIGYDHNDSDNTRALQSRGVQITQKPDLNLLEPGDLVIYSTAIKPDHPLRKAALDKGLEVLHRSEFLKTLMQDSFKILITGTHGKTTTTAMIGHMLTQLGLQPTVYAGGVLREQNRCAYAGNSKLFVAEIDESDGSFLQHDPDICVITNIDLDHLDYFGTIDKLLAAFTTFSLRCDKENGSVILGWNSPYVRNIFPKVERQTLTYGNLIGCDVRAYNLEETQGHIAFKAVIEHQPVEVKMPAIGVHSCLNALASLSVAKIMELDLSRAALTLTSFAGVERRHSVIYQKSNLWVIDDYAHNPGKILNSVQAVKKSWPKARLLCVFEPHRYSRLAHMLEQFAQAFSAADHVYVMPVYSAGEQKIAEFDATQIAQQIFKHSHVESSVFKSVENFANDIRHDLFGQKVVLFLGAGDSSQTARSFAELLD